MGAKGNKFYSEETTFHELAEDIEKDPEPVDLQSKVLEYQDKRNSKRETLNTTITIFDSRAKVLSKAVLKNLSPEGLRFEILPVELKKTDDIYVQFNSALNLGMILCSIQWVIDLAGHRKNHKLMGAKFKKVGRLKQKQLNEFLENLNHKRNRDPFYVG